MVVLDQKTQEQSVFWGGKLLWLVQITYNEKLMQTSMKFHNAHRLFFAAVSYGPKQII